MADLDLRTDYKDDILDSSVNEKRIYNLVDSDGNIVVENVSLVDNSIYNQKGDSFGAVDINKTNQAVLDLNQSLTSVEQGLNSISVAPSGTQIVVNDNITSFPYDYVPPCDGWCQLEPASLPPALGWISIALRDKTDEKTVLSNLIMAPINHGVSICIPVLKGRIVRSNCSKVTNLRLMFTPMSDE